MLQGTMMISAEFLLTSLVVVLIPGTGVIYTISTGLFQGWRASTAAAVGCTAGIIPHLTACVLGLAALLHMSALAFQAVKFAGVAYLFYLAWSMWRESGALTFEEADNAKDTNSRWRILVKGFLINILNPKLSIFFLAFMPQFVVPGNKPALVQLLTLSAIFMLMTLVIFILYGFCATGVRHYVAHSPRLIKWLQRGFAASFAALGTKLALTD